MAARKAATESYRETMPDGTKLERRFRTDDDGTREGYGNWLWVVYDPDRRPARKRVNLYTRDKAVAFGKAVKLAKRLDAGTFDPWADASPQEGLTVAKAAKRYTTWKARGGASPATVETDRGHLDRFDRWLPAGALVKQVERHHVEGFLDRPKKGRDGKPGGKRSPAGQARTLATLQHFWGWAVDNGVTPQDPTAGVTVAKVKAERRDHITEDEEAAIIRAVGAAEILSGESRQWLRDWLEFGTHTGLRPGEQGQLRWSAVRLAEGRVEIGKGHRVKTRESARQVPVRGRALDVLTRLAEARQTETDGPVFTGAGGTAAVNVGYLSKQLQRFASEAGVEKNVTAYSLRHSFGTRMALGGTPLYLLAQLMGTSVAMIEKHYGHFDPARGAAHMERVFAEGAPASEGTPARSRLAARRRRRRAAK